MRQLLQKETENSYQKFILKCDRGLLQSTSGIAKCDRSLLESVTPVDTRRRFNVDTTSYRR